MQKAAEERKRRIKTVLAREFGYRNVRVWGNRTPLEWLKIRIKAPKPHEGPCPDHRMCDACYETVQEIEKKVWEILKESGVYQEIDTYYDDRGKARKRCMIDVDLRS